MKKLTFLGSSIAYLLAPFQALAASPPSAVKISPPPVGYTQLAPFVTNIVTLAFAVALIMVLIMLVWGAFEWITSGGDKDHVASARNRIINALIGFAVLAVAFALARLFGQFVGIDITDIQIPGPQ